MRQAGRQTRGMTANLSTQWYAITPVAKTAEGVTRADVLIYGDIGDSWAEESVTASKFVRDFMGLQADEVTIRINSIGGSVPDGIAIHNAIRRHDGKKIVVVDGLAASIASLIAMAGDSVEMADNATMMIHAPWTFAAGNSAQLRETADVLDTWASAMATSYARKTGKSQQDMLALLTDGQDHWFTASEAVAAGFADGVVDQMPMAASVSMDISRFKNVPQALLPRPKDPAGVPAEPTAAAAAIPSSTTEKTMTYQVNAAAAPDTAAQDAVRAALAADRTRRDGIKAKFANFVDREGVAALMQECQDDQTCTPQAAGERLLNVLGSKMEPVAGHVVTVEDEADKRRDAAVVALMARAGVATAEAKRDLGANPFRGSSLLDLARASLGRANLRTDGMDKMQLVAAAFTQTGSDFPVLLENTMHKTLQQAYALAPDTWSRFCARGSVSDFRAHNRYRVSSLGNLRTISEAGEYTNENIPDGEKSQISVDTKGYIINMTRQMVINDDLGAFVGMSAAMGRAARRSIEADVYAVLTSNGGLGPVLLDGKTLFHADHGNIGAGAALTMESIDADRVLMAQQMDVGGNDFLDLRPEILLVPIGLGAQARTVNDAQYDPDTPNKLQKPNTVRGLYGDIVDTPRLSGTRRYSFASPSIAPALEVAFLDGNDAPFLEQQQGFDVDGSRFKIRLDYGIAGIDYRGCNTNAGA